MDGRGSTDNMDLTLPAGFTSAVNRFGRTYYLNHTDRTTTFIHPIHTDYREPYTEGLPYPFERKITLSGRAYYADHETHTTSWLNPLKLKELKAQGYPGASETSVDDKDGLASKPWIVVEKATAPKEGELYYVNYRTGEVEEPVAREEAGKKPVEAREGKAKL
ncbi:hypothetical protein MMC11_009090 [Xylographa trunciseda]|nr:hypothetical protein [Xylographa trunciseda]